MIMVSGSSHFAFDSTSDEYAKYKGYANKLN